MKLPFALTLPLLAISAPALAQAVPKTERNLPATDTSLSFSTGVDYSEGTYGSTVKTKILVVPASVRVKTGDFRFGATLPYLRIDGANVVGGGAGGPIVINPTSPRTVRSGLGDLSLSATYAVPEDRYGLGVEFTGRVKLPTASTSRGLGTGKTDVSALVDVSKSFGNVTPFVDVGYKWTGDPSYINLKNTWFGSAGLSVAAGKSVIIASYDYQGATSPLSFDSHEVFGAFSTPVSDRLNFTLYGSAGLSRGAPDFGVGGIVTIKAF